MLFYRSAEAAGQKSAMQTVKAPVHDPAGIEASLRAAGREPGGGPIIPPHSFMSARFKFIVQVATRYNVLARFQFRYFTTEGGLVSYGIDLPDPYRRSAAACPISYPGYAGRFASAGDQNQKACQD